MAWTIKTRLVVKMTNEPILNAKFIPPAPPRHHPKTEESAEIARLVDEFLAKGGKIKTGHGNKIDKTVPFVMCENFTVWPQREYVLQVMRDKFITKSGLATKTKLRFSLVSQVLAGERLPDNREHQLILDTVENWRIKL